MSSLSPAPNLVNFPPKLCGLYVEPTAAAVEPLLLKDAETVLVPVLPVFSNRTELTIGDEAELPTPTQLLSVNYRSRLPNFRAALGRPPSCRHRPAVCVSVALLENVIVPPIAKPDTVVSPEP